MSSVTLQGIPEMFVGVDVFITGGSGFMGKVLIEKLLRSCPGIGQVFVLLRPRKGKSAQERVEELVQVPLFDKLRELRPNDFQKIVPICGDCSRLQMGLDEQSKKRLETVQFVFHAAASVRFDDPLVDAILLNTRGTREVFRWSKTLKNLRVLVHISTTYSNPEIFEIDERIYPAKMDWQKAIEIAEKIDSEILEAMAPKLTNFAPNTYTFTKGLAEQICYDYHKELPLVIFRPSIVTSAETEPIPGWIENFNGPAGLMVGAGTGVLRTSCMNMDSNMNCIPVDVSIKAILIATWQKANEAPGQLTIINSAAEPNKTVAYRLLETDGITIYHKAPFERILWAPGSHNTRCVYFYYLLLLLCQVMPSVLIDTMLRALGRKPFLMKLQRRIFHAQVSLHYFTTNQWSFVTTNFRKLSTILLENDRANFNLDYIVNGVVEYFQVCHLGGRRHLLKESDDTIPAARNKLERYNFYNQTLKFSIFSIVFYILYNKYYHLFV
ncbi:fatty acyl-CoA reductase 1-like [Topomyia yanbarensis]|uniref:fatty acyl-CoA reductase 1-like n=1 Tax=Topomyia yanbarensis TaxID=2498891 RepID=UPI00273B2B8A|nr:fatty acyl-CoA reductase 1-like [Topomyia yanbarensis]